MATAHQIRDLIAQTTTGSARPHVPREVRDEVCRYARARSPSPLVAAITSTHQAKAEKAYGLLVRRAFP